MHELKTEQSCNVLNWKFSKFSHVAASHLFCIGVCYLFFSPSYFVEVFFWEIDPCFWLSNIWVNFNPDINEYEHNQKPQPLSISENFSIWNVLNIPDDGKKLQVEFL